MERIIERGLLDSYYVLLYKAPVCKIVILSLIPNCFNSYCTFNGQLDTVGESETQYNQQYLTS